MSWNLRYAASAVRSLRELDPQVQRRLKTAVEELAENPERGKPLQMTLRGLRSWRTGDFRIVYRVLTDRIEILVLAIGHRRDVYERIRRLLD
jgi:mRNA interferase RelE/StbE